MAEASVIITHSKRPGGVWFVAISFAVIYALFLAVVILVSATWERLPASAKLPIQNLSFFVWVRSATNIVAWGYGVVQFFRLRAECIWAFGACALYSLLVIVFYTYDGRPIAPNVVGLIVEVLVVWYAYDLWKAGVIRYASPNKALERSRYG